MGRGKKKGSKQETKTEEEPSISSLTISDPQPTSSGSVQQEEEVGLGLTGGSRKKKGKEKSATVIKPATEEPLAESAKPIHTPQPSDDPAPKLPTPAPELEVEDEGGLGLTGGRKRNPRKKKPKSDATPAGPTEYVTAPPATVVAAPHLHGQQVQSAAGPDKQMTFGGYGRGRGRGDSAPKVSSQFPTPHASSAFPTSQATPGFPTPQATPGFPTPRARPAFPTPQAIPGFPTPQATPGFPTPQATPGLPTPNAPPGFSTPRPTQTPWSRTQSQTPSLPVQQRPQTAGPPLAVPATKSKESTSQMQRKSSEPQSSQICLFKIPNKIPGGRVPAQAIRVLANYLKMEIKPLKISRYDIAFKPDKPKKMIPRAFNLAKEKCFPEHIIAFDQMKNCYALKPLPRVTASERFVTNVQIVDNNGKQMEFEVSFKATGTVDLGTILSYMQNGTSLNPPTEAIQCVDVVLRQGTLESYIKAGRQFFKRPGRPIDLGDGLEMWTGLFQSAIFTSRPFVNIDVAHKGFPKQQPLIQAIQNDFRLDINKPIEQQRGRGVENFMMFIKGLRVIATVGGDKTSSAQKREFICNGLAEPPSRLKFTMTDQSGKQTQMTVYDYFTREKRCRLQYPNLNCMWVGPRDKNIYYPIELLDVSYGQALNKQLNEMQLSTMVREAATPPDERKRKIEEVIKDMNYSRNPYFREFGLEISNEFFEVEAKVLRPPNLDVGDRNSVMPRKGAWQARVVYKPEALETWGFIAIETDPRNCNFENIKRLLMNEGRSMGMRVAEPMMTHFNATIRDLDNYLYTAVEKGINFLFIVVSTRGKDYYHRVKQKAEREVGILTQCIREMTAARRMNPQTARNILLKVNSKLMGINQVLDGHSMPNCLRSGNVMVVGADVTHPSPEQTSVPSIAAVTASIDPKCFQYNIALSIQTPKKEMIVEFEDMMVEHLQVYKMRNHNTLPKKIFVFRDGVSEGQFAQVMNSELQAVHRAYRVLTGTNVKPEVLFLLVQKRHHTRFFLGAKNSQNVEPGTVVDKHIVHARELDFYLVSHQAIKGTARPTRYHAVCNDGGIPDDEVEQLTYYLCHLYSRCMRAVSYPTPTYYAHLACLRARSLTYGEKFDNKELEQKPRRLRVLDKMLSFSRMFFV